MRKVIHHLRKQPVHVRHTIAHVLTLIFAVLLLSIWVYRLGLPASSEPALPANSADTLEPFTILKDNLVDGYESITAPE